MKKITDPQLRELRLVAGGKVLSNPPLELHRIQRMADGTVRSNFKNPRPNHVAQILSRLEGMGLVKRQSLYYALTNGGRQVLEAKNG